MPTTETTYARQLGAAMKKARITKGETQEQTARNMGVALRAYTRWETGTHAPHGASELIVFSYFGWPHRLLEGDTNNLRSQEIGSDLLELWRTPADNRSGVLVAAELVAVGGLSDAES